MSLHKTVHFPWFDSQPGSCQRDEPGPQQTLDQTESRSQRLKRGNKRGDLSGEKSRFLLKVKFPKFNNKNVSKKTPRRRTRESTTNITNTQELTSVSPQANRIDAGAGADSDPVGGDVFIFSQRSTSTAVNEKEKAKLAVLRTISTMLQENRLIRERLAVLSQAN